MKKTPFFWLSLIGGVGLVLLLSIALWSWTTSQGLFQQNNSAQAVVDKVYAEAKIITQEVNSQLIVVEKNQQSLKTSGGFTMPQAIEGQANKDLISVVGINSPSFSITTKDKAVNQPRQTLTESEQTQTTADLLSINSRLLNTLIAKGFSIVDTSTETPPAGNNLKTNYLKNSNDPEVICALNVEDTTNTSGFQCISEADFLARANEIKPFVSLYRANKNLYQEPGLSFSDSVNNIAGENGYEIRQILYGQSVTIFYRKQGTSNWSSGNVQLSYQSYPKCEELKKDPAQVAAMAGYATVDGQQKYQCFKGNSTDPIPVSPSM